MTSTSKDKRTRAELILANEKLIGELRDCLEKIEELNSKRSSLQREVQDLESSCLKYKREEKRIKCAINAIDTAMEVSFPDFEIQSQGRNCYVPSEEGNIIPEPVRIICHIYAVLTGRQDESS